MSKTDISRFLNAQDGKFDNYQTALAEITNGRKESHWIWYIFPQIKGLGFSEMSQYFGITDIAEAKVYLQNPILKDRLYEITNSLLLHSGKSPEAVLGGIDAMKVKSSMTLFDVVSPNDVFADVLDKFYNGERCKKTLELLGK